jgi:hypothetical protein
MSNLRDATIRLAFENLEMRPKLLPLLGREARSSAPYAQPGAKLVVWDDLTRQNDNTTQAMAKHLVHAKGPQKTGKGFLLFPEAFAQLPQKNLEVVAKSVIQGFTKSLAWRLALQVEDLPSVLALRGEEWDELGPGPEGDETYGYRDQDPTYEKLLSAVRSIRPKSQIVTSPKTGKKGIRVEIRPSIGDLLRKFKI